MKITRKHIFIISGIIGLIALVVVIIIKVVNTSKTCDTSGGKKLYCNNTVCIDCGQGKTYDCDKGMCVVTCDTSGGEKLYCNNTVCIDCGLNKIYDCDKGKKCICDTGFKECGDNCCPNEKTCIKPAGTQATTCCSTEKQCGLLNDSNVYTDCCKDTDYCINPSDGGSTYCCDGGKEPCGYDSDAKLYTTCCKGDKQCSIDSVCVLKCPEGKQVCGDVCCTTGTCIKPDDDTDPYCCTDGVPCNGTKCCQGGDATCGASGECEITCNDPDSTLYCKNTVCAKTCSSRQIYDCTPEKGKCICDPVNYPTTCDDDTCCPSGQGCYVKTDSSNACCNTDQRCGLKQNGQYTQCCDPDSMCGVNNECVKRCALDEQFLNCQDNSNLCIKALNLDDKVKKDLMKSAADDENIVGGKVICNDSTNNCAYCIKNAPKNFSGSEWRYPLKVGNFSVGSYIIGDLGGGGSSNAGYCTYASQDDTDGDKHSFCNRYINVEECKSNPSENCFWNSFLPQDTATDLTTFYSALENQFTNDENNINQYNHQDIVNKYNGVWENKDDKLSHYVVIKPNAEGKNVSLSDCVAYNSQINGISNITYLDNKTNQLCLGGFDFPSVDFDTCNSSISNSGYACNDNGNITQDTSCKSSCSSTSYSTGENWYNQPSSNNLWGCSSLTWVKRQGIHPEDTKTNFCPDYDCIESEMRISYGQKIGSLLATDITYYQNKFIGNPYNGVPRRVFGYRIRIVNKTSCTIRCDFNSNGKNGTPVYIGQNSYSDDNDICVGGATYNAQVHTSDSNFSLSFDNGSDQYVFSTFQIQYVSVGSIQDYGLLKSLETGIIRANLKGLTCTFITSTPFASGAVLMNSINIIVYPTVFQKDKNLEEVLIDSYILANAGAIIYRVIN